MSVENVIWKGSPSHWTNFWSHVGCLLLAVGAIVGGVFFPPVFAAVVIPVGIVLWKWLTVRCTVFELTSQRLRMSQGVFTRTIDEIELYRVKDSLIEQPFWLRVVGLGNLIMDTSDRSHPKAELNAISDVIGVHERVRERVEKLRDAKRVREVDFDNAGGGTDEFDDGLEID
ncbi:MAG: PH domain-containing protein [Verrucomicrobiales bacterium]|nr:PH domain-containing protein [Verrucomicrobiales bacterium]